jgi:hypothetical protein
VTREAVARAMMRGRKSNPGIPELKGYIAPIGFPDEKDLCRPPSRLPIMLLHRNPMAYRQELYGNHYLPYHSITHKQYDTMEVLQLLPY